MRRDDRDPYTPPPRHRDGSGAVVRFVIVAALLGAAAWGYMAYKDQPQTALAPPDAQEQTLADSSYDAVQPAAPDQGQTTQAETPAEPPS